MLCLSFHYKDQSGYIRFESEPYYSRLNRLRHTSKDIDIVDKGLLLRDAVFKESLAFSILLSLLVGKSYPNGKERDLAQIVYPHMSQGNTVIRIDEEKYEFKPHRQFLEELPLPSLDKDQVYPDEGFKQVLAERILTHLPISEELCMHESEPIDA